MSTSIRTHPWAMDIRRPRFGESAGIIGSIVVLAVAVAMLLNLVPGPGVLHAITVQGGSMGNALPTGSIAITRTINPVAVSAGDVIAIAGSAHGTIVLHRVVSVERGAEGITATTKGDANSKDDPHPVLLRGRGDRVVLDVPFVGYAYAFVRSTEGLVALGTLVLVPSLFAPLVRKLRRRSPEVRAYQPEIQSIVLLQGRMQKQRGHHVPQTAPPHPAGRGSDRESP